MQIWKLAVLPLCLTFVALGIGHAASDEPALAIAPQGIADGVWVGADHLGRPAFGLMSSFKRGKEMQYFFATGNGAGHYMPAYAGFMTLGHGATASGAVLGPQDVAVRGMYAQRDANTLSSRVFDARSGATESRYTLNYSIDNDILPSLEQLQGRYARSALPPADDDQDAGAALESLAIDSRGMLAGHVPGCTLNGQVTIRDADRNLYHLALTARPESPHQNCLGFDNPGDSVALSGLASLVILPNETTRSLVFAASGFRAGYPLMLAGAIPKL